jgi:hypothetical protein
MAGEVILFFVSPYFCLCYPTPMHRHIHRLTTPSYPGYHIEAYTEYGARMVHCETVYMAEKELKRFSSFSQTHIKSNMCSSALLHSPPSFPPSSLPLPIVHLIYQHVRSSPRKYVQNVAEHFDSSVG